MVTVERKHCFIFPLFEEKWNRVLSPWGVRAAQELLFLLNLLPFICRHPLRSRDSSQDRQPWSLCSRDIAFIINAQKFHPNCVRELLMKAWVRTQSGGMEMGRKSHKLVLIVRTKNICTRQRTAVAYKWQNLKYTGFENWRTFQKVLTVGLATKTLNIMC